MSQAVHGITTPFVLNVSVNCYFVETNNGYILIDTGRTVQRRMIESTLDNAGCKPGNVRLIVLTHGDFDHSGNAAYFREKYGAKIAMHQDDAGMVERGDFFWNRKTPNILVRTLFGLIFCLNPSDRFIPNIYLKEGDDLSKYGFDARVIQLPGHSRGSIGFVTADGGLFCGDLLANTGKPEVWSIVDDKTAMKTSGEKVKGLQINMVYPGHGKPFLMEAFRKRDQAQKQGGSVSERQSNR